jgi:hypothetical protein
VFDDFQGAGDGGGRVAEREPDAFFAVVNCKDSHDCSATVDGGP